MRRLLLVLFLWFWLALAVVAAILLAMLVHGGLHTILMRISVHDFSLFLIGGAIFCYFLASYLTRPLQKLAEAAAAIAQGRLDTRVDPSLRRRKDEIATLAANFDRMAERIEALVEGQRRLLGDVSHELRSPLSRLTVALSLARQSPPEEVAENLDRIGIEARRLDALIGQLLTLNRIDTGVDRKTAAVFDLANLVQEVASDADFEARARRRRVLVTRADACQIRGFEEPLRSAIENVVRNAIRYTPEGTAVEISLCVQGAVAALEVRDSGPGVPPAMLAQIFQPFQRVDGSSSEGAGLGLAIARRAVEIHGGVIEARNLPQGGLAVEIRLPLNG